MNKTVKTMKSRIKDLSMQELLELKELVDLEHQARIARRAALGPWLESLGSDALSALLNLYESKRRMK